MNGRWTNCRKKWPADNIASRSITDLYLKRIEDIDKKGPAINAVIEINPEAQAIADKMDAERKAGKVRGALHGIPVLIKDNIDTGDKMMTTAGSLSLAGNIASKDAFIIRQLREAGAVILGKTNLSEWANFRSTRSNKRVEQSRRPNKKSLHPGSQPLRIQFRVGRGRGSKSLRNSHWN